MKAIDFLNKKGADETAISFLNSKKGMPEKDAMAFLGDEPVKKTPILKTVGREIMATPQALAGTAEALTATTTGLVGQAVGGLTKLSALTPWVTVDEAEKAGEYVAGKLTYQPKTNQAQTLIETMGYPFEKLSEYGKKRADIEFKETGSAVSAAAKKTLYDVAPILAGGRAFKKPKAPRITKPKKLAPKSTESKFISEEFAKEFLNKPEVGGGKPPKSGLAVANIGADGKIYYGKAGEIHLNLSEKYSNKIRTSKKLKEGEPTWKDLGFTDSSGEFLSRKEALKQTPKTIRSKISKYTKELKEELGGYDAEMDALTYREIAEHAKTVKTKKQPTTPLKPKKAKVEAPVKATTGGTKLYGGLPIHKIHKTYTKYIGEPIWDKAIMKGIPKALEKVPGGKAINRALLYEYRGNLAKSGEFVKSMDTMKRNQSIGREYAVDLGNRLQVADEVTQLKMGEYIKGGNPKLSKNELALAGEAKQVLYDLGKQAVDLELLSGETFFKNAGRYMPRLYTSKEYQSLLTRFKVSKPNRLDLSRFQKRKDIPKEVRKEMGEILTPGYPVAKGIMQLTHDIEMAKFFKNTAKNPEWSLPKKSSVAIPNGWKQLPSDKKLGSLSEAYVHPEIFADISEVIRMQTKGDKIWRKSLGAWKFGKVILSPKTHARNLMSNSILAHLGGMPMYEQPVYLTKAVKAMRGKTNYWKIAKKEGLLRETFTNAELRSLFDQVEGQLKGIKAGGIPEKIGTIGNFWEKGKASMGKAAKLYEAEEQWFKMAKFIHNVERKKMSPMKAAKDAEKWLFNYSKVTKFQEKYRSKWYGAPFATFTFKALPRIAEAAVKTPHRFILPAAMIYGLEEATRNYIGDTKEQAKAKQELRPDYMKGKTLGMSNFPRVPVVDDHGREYYLNLTYILPWGDLAEGGGFMGIPGGLRPFSQPFINEPVQQIANYDFFWKDPIVKEKELAGKTKTGRITAEVKARAGHLAKTLLPTPVLDVSKAVSALRGVPDYKGRERPGKVVAADVIAGVKMYPVDYVDQMMKKINKLHPKKGRLGRAIRYDIKILYTKKNAMAKKGKSVKFLEKQIENKIKQLKGLAEEVKEAGKIYQKAVN